MASHDRDMQATCSFVVLCVLYANLFEQFHDLNVAMVRCIVQAVKALRVFVIDSVPQRALRHDLDYVLPARIYDIKTDSQLNMLYYSQRTIYMIQFVSKIEESRRSTSKTFLFEWPTWNSLV